MLLASCQGSPFFTRYQSVDSEGWCARDYLRYRLPDVGHDTDATFRIGVRTTSLYSYSGLSLRVRLYEQGREVMCDTVRFGIFGGDSHSDGSGFPFTTHQQELTRRYTLRKDSVYRLRIYHIMRKDPLPGISDVGVEVIE